MKLLCIHQGYELYGSDRSFIESVHALRSAFPDAEIDVVLPREGPIADYLRDDATRVIFEPLWVLRKHSLVRLATIDLARLPLALLRAWKRTRDADIVYINTSVVFDYTLVSRLFPDKVILHAHEIPEGFALQVIRRLLRWSKAELIFNSRATKRAFPDLADRRSHVIYNGVAIPAELEPIAPRPDGPFKILMLGRINRIKGQEVLVDAVTALPQAFRERVSVRIVGSAFGSDAPYLALQDRIAEAGLETCVALMPFVADPTEHFRWADIVVVPSRMPESLGRVAIEAMAFGRPAVVSAIGGLAEIVDDGHTGWLVPPGDASALSARLQAIMADPRPLPEFARAGRQRYEQMFNPAVVATAIGRVFREKLARRQTGLQPRPGEVRAK